MHSLTRPETRTVLTVISQAFSYKYDLTVDLPHRDEQFRDNVKHRGFASSACSFPQTRRVRTLSLLIIEDRIPAAAVSPCSPTNVYDTLLATLSLGTLCNCAMMSPLGMQPYASHNGHCRLCLTWQVLPGSQRSKYKHASRSAPSCPLPGSQPSTRTSTANWTISYIHPINARSFSFSSP